MHACTHTHAHTHAHYKYKHYWWWVGTVRRKRQISMQKENSRSVCRKRYVFSSDLKEAREDECLTEREREYLITGLRCFNTTLCWKHQKQGSDRVLQRGGFAYSSTKMALQQTYKGKGLRQIYKGKGSDRSTKGRAQTDLHRRGLGGRTQADPQREGLRNLQRRGLRQIYKE